MLSPEISDRVWLLLAAALLLDAWLGEPAWLWSRLRHPAALMGDLVSWLEARLNHGRARRLKGAAALALLLAAAGGAAWVLASAPWIGAILSTIGAAILLAQRSLIEHVEAVANGLGRGLPQGRAAVALIVGRDPESLDQSGVARAAIESCAENFSDGVIAPAFWFLVGGLPGVALYKAVNTADSMIGHRSERYRRFGWAAARLDDVMNLIPARLAGLLLAITAGPRRVLPIMWREAGKHASPNAGWPEAAMAGALNLSLAGPRRYGERLTENPYLHPEGRRNAGAADIRAAAGLTVRAWTLLVMLLLLTAVIDIAVEHFA